MITSVFNQVWILFFELKRPQNKAIKSHPTHLLSSPRFRLMRISINDVQNWRYFDLWWRHDHWTKCQCDLCLCSRNATKFTRKIKQTKTFFFGCVFLIFRFWCGDTYFPYTKVVPNCFYGFEEGVHLCAPHLCVTFKTCSSNYGTSFIYNKKNISFAYTWLDFVFIINFLNST